MFSLLGVGSRREAKRLRRHLRTLFEELCPQAGERIQVFMALPLFSLTQTDLWGDIEFSSSVAGRLLNFLIVTGSGAQEVEYMEARLEGYFCFRPELFEVILKSLQGMLPLSEEEFLEKIEVFLPGLSASQLLEAGRDVWFSYSEKRERWIPLRIAASGRSEESERTTESKPPPRASKEEKTPAVRKKAGKKEVPEVRESAKGQKASRLRKAKRSKKEG
jgi:hypothetical protein